jgi:hypothetical protein
MSRIRTPDRRPQLGCHGPARGSAGSAAAFRPIGPGHRLGRRILRRSGDAPGLPSVTPWACRKEVM